MRISGFLLSDDADLEAENKTSYEHMAVQPQRHQQSGGLYAASLKLDRQANEMSPP